MKWTKEKPTKPGWYWFRNKENTQRVIEVQIDRFGTGSDELWTTLVKNKFSNGLSKEAPCSLCSRCMALEVVFNLVLAYLVAPPSALVVKKTFWKFYLR